MKFWKINPKVKKTLETEDYIKIGTLFIKENVKTELYIINRFKDHVTVHNIRLGRTWKRSIPVDKLILGENNGYITKKEFIYLAGNKNLASSVKFITIEDVYYTCKEL